MFRSASFAIALFACAVSLFADDASVQSYFTGKEVIVKLDMPGTQKGVDLRFNKPSPMDWKEYSSRLKQAGTAIHKGDTARVTSVVVKKDMIEFQLDGGGYGTFGDDTTTKVEPKTLAPSDYEKSLEKQISETTDDDKRAQLQHDLDRERARREKQQAAANSDAQIASQLKAQQVAQKRAQGGSRFNLRWSGAIPADQLTPEAIMKLLADYVDFSALHAPAATATAAAPNAQPGAAPSTTPQAASSDAGSPTAQLKRGMKFDEVTTLLGPGKQLSESVGDQGLKTQVYEYFTSDRRAEVTFVDGLVVRFSVSSR